MTQRAALVELIERVEKGELDNDTSEIDATDLVIDALGYESHSLFFVTWGGDDLSCAVKLLAHMLPGALWAVSGGSIEGYFAAVSRHSGSHPTLPARALLLATLRAKLATMGEGEG